MNSTQKKYLSLVSSALLVMIFLVSKQFVHAQSLNEELNQVTNTVKETVRDVSQQLSGEVIAETTVKEESSTSSVSANSANTDSKETIDEIKKRLEKTVEDTKVRGTSKEQRQKLGFIGEVVRVSEEAVTVSSAANTTIVPLKDVQIVKSNKLVSLSEVIVGNWVTVVGISDGQSISDDNFQARYIIVASDSLEPTTKMVTLGTIESIEPKSLSLAPRSGGEAITFSTTTKTTYQDSDGSKAKLTQFEADMNVLVIAFEEVSDKENEPPQKIISTIRSLAPLEE